MIEAIANIALGYLACKVLSALTDGPGKWFGITWKPPGAPGASPYSIVPAVVDTGKPEAKTPAVLTSTTTAWPEEAPAGLPPFPSGWQSARTTPAIVDRAWSVVRDPSVALKSRKLEHWPDGRWLSFYKHRTPAGKTGVTVYEPKTTATRPGAVTV